MNGTLDSTNDRTAYTSLSSISGSVDELSASIGVASHYCEEANNGLSATLANIQCTLIELGSNIATPRDSEDTSLIERTQFDVDGQLLEYATPYTLESKCASFTHLTPSLLPNQESRGYDR